MNGDSAVKTDDLIETSSHCQGENVIEKIITIENLEPANDKQANGIDSENSSDEKSTDQKLSDEKLPADKISDEKLKDDELSDEDQSVKKISDEKMTNEKLLDEKVSDESIPDEKLSDKKLLHEELSDGKLSDEDLSDQDIFADNISDGEMSDEKLSDEKLLDEKLSGETPSHVKVASKDVTINPNDLSKKPNEKEPDGADVSTKNTLDDSIKNLDTVASDGNEGVSCNLNCDEKVAESDSDPLAQPSSDSERALINKESPSTKVNNDDTVSVNSKSDEDELLCLGETTPNSDIILIDGEQNGDFEVHEILSDDDNDDCIVTSEKAEEPPLASRRTKRVRKRNRYYASEDEQESDLEVIPIDDPLNDRVKLKNKRKSASATLKQRKSKKSGNILVVDAMDIVKKKDKSSNPIKTYAVDSKKLHEDIAACGTTITPVSAKDSSNAVTIVQQPVQEPEPILPSLTDDMFVVEAPSFIVPYVYEKPAEVHFKNFVTKLGTELEEQKTKEEELRIQKEKEDKEKREKEIQERKERGEDYSDLLDNDEKDKEAKEEEKQKKKQLKEERRRKRRAGEEDDPAWEADNAETSSSEDLSDDDVKARDDDDIAILPTEVAAPKIDAYFTTTLGKFFMDIGMNLVQENVQHELLKQENRKLNREKRGGYNVKATQSSIAALTNNIEKSKEKNASFTFTFEKCKLCSFKSESSIVMANHMEVPHMKNNMFVCNFCPREIKGCHDILVHMLLEHQVKGRLERSQVSQQCATCPYEDNNKARLGRHIINCMKKFKPETNLAITEWEPPAKIPKLVKPPSLPGNAFLNSRGVYAGVNVNRAGQASGTNSFHAKPVPLRPLPRPNILTKAKDPVSKQIIPPPKALVPPNIMQRNRPGMEGNKSQATLAISPLPSGRSQNTTDSTFVMCEICDGYIKDLDQLRNHMLWIHKIKIHPKMIHNRPPLNCQKCQFRFFTDQGLERHLLGAHGLVTNSMQEAANSRKDCGRCPICGRVYQYKLLGHVARDHNMNLKPAHLSYKCTVCTATFDTYKDFECHVYSAHRVVTKRLAEKAKATEPAK